MEAVPLPPVDVDVGCGASKMWSQNGYAQTILHTQCVTYTILGVAGELLGTWDPYRTREKGTMEPGTHTIPGEGYLGAWRPQSYIRPLYIYIDALYILVFA